jgi:hypothetical protein
MCQDHIAGFENLLNFAQKNTVCDHSLIFNPKKIKMKNPEFFGIFFNILNSEFWIQLYIIWKHRPLPKGWIINLCPPSLPPSLPSFLPFPFWGAGWTSIHQGTSTGCPLLLSCGWISTELIFGFTLITNSVRNRSHI